MAQLVIIDVQQCFDGSKDLDEKILEYSKEFADIVFIQDIINGDEVFPHDMWEEMAIAFENGEFSPMIIQKEYAFFRGLMDKGCDEDFIVDLGKLMVKKNIWDAREISEDMEAAEELQKLYKKHGEEEIDFEGWSFYLPHAIEEIGDKIIQGAILVGGGYNECLKEISLLLNVLDIQHSINQAYVY